MPPNARLDDTDWGVKSDLTKEGSLLRASIVILAGIGVIAYTAIPAFWRSFKRLDDMANPIVGPFSTRIWARNLDMDEVEVRAIYARFVRGLWFVCGAAMVIGGVAFLVGHGWAWDW